MKACILTGGCLPPDDVVRDELNDAGMVVCADSGMAYAREHGILPDLIIGDMDSAQPEDLTYFEEQDVQIIVLDTEKDETDTEAAVDQALIMGADEIVILGGTGMRLDHSLGNMQVLYGLMEKRIPSRMEGRDETVYVTNSRLPLNDKKGHTLSVVPMGGGCVIGKLAGVKYPLENQYLKRGSTLGISNEITDDVAGIIVIHGRVSVVISR